MHALNHRVVDTNGIRMHIAEQGEGPLVILCHGFPESWYSWRHQLQVLAEAGYHAVAPDMRGYGESEAPKEIEKYTLLHLVGDVVGLVHALGASEATVVGHDWGAPVAWHAALLRPDLFRRVAALSTPFRPRPSSLPSANMPSDAKGMVTVSATRRKTASAPGSVVKGCRRWTVHTPSVLTMLDRRAAARRSSKVAVVPSLQPSVPRFGSVFAGSSASPSGRSGSNSERREFQFGNDLAASLRNIRDAASRRKATSVHLCCDASLLAIVEDTKGIRSTSVARHAQHRQPCIARFVARDVGCRYPGCTNTRYVDAHHIVHWADGGDASLDNLMLLCSVHRDESAPGVRV